MFLQGRVLWPAVTWVIATESSIVLLPSGIEELAQHPNVLMSFLPKSPPCPSSSSVKC